MSVVGVDACKRGWIGIEVRDQVTGHFVDKLENLSAHVPDAQTVAIDIPIGLSGGRRQADVVARELLGPRRSSVCLTPSARRWWRRRVRTQRWLTPFLQRAGEQG